MPTLVVVCRHCGGEFAPAPSDFLRGTWRTCLACRDEMPPAAPADQPRDETTPTNRPTAAGVTP